MSVDSKFPHVEGAVVVAKAKAHSRAEHSKYQGQPGEFESEKFTLVGSDTQRNA